MKKAWRVFYHEFLTNVQRKSYLLFTFAVPLLLFVAAEFLPGLLAGDGSPEDVVGMLGLDAGHVVGVVDQSERFAAPETGSDFAQYIQFYESEGAARAALDQGDIHAYLIIDPNFMETGTIYRYAEQLDLMGIGKEENLIENFLNRQMVGETELNLAARLGNPANFDKHITEPTAKPSDTPEAQARGEGVAFVLPYVFGMVMMVGALFSAGYLMTSVTKEKENRMIEIVLSSVKPFPLLLGKVLAAGALGLIQVGVYMGTFWIIAASGAVQQIAGLTGLTVPPRLVIFGLIYFVGAFFMVGGVYAAIAAVVERSQEAANVAGFVVLPLVLPLALIGAFAEAPHSTVSVILSLFPLTAPMSMVMRLSLASVPMLEIVISLAMTTVGAVASIWFASRLFRVNTLLAGQLPSLRTLWRLVREG